MDWGGSKCTSISGTEVVQANSERRVLRRAAAADVYLNNRLYDVLISGFGPVDGAASCSRR
jgi:hypothetical protein